MSAPDNASKQFKYLLRMGRLYMLQNLNLTVFVSRLRRCLSFPILKMVFEDSHRLGQSTWAKAEGSFDDASLTKNVV